MGGRYDRADAVASWTAIVRSGDWEYPVAIAWGATALLSVQVEVLVLVSVSVSSVLVSVSVSVLVSVVNLLLAMLEYLGTFTFTCWLMDGSCSWCTLTPVGVKPLLSEKHASKERIVSILCIKI